MRSTVRTLVRLTLAALAATGLAATCAAQAKGDATPPKLQPTMQVSQPGVTVSPAGKGGVAVPPAGGVLVVEQPTYDAGNIERGEPIRHAFEIKNTGTGPLTIDAKPG